MAFNTAKAFISQKAGPNYPAPLEALSSMEKTVHLHRDQTIELEINGFIKVQKLSLLKTLLPIFI